MIDRLLPAVAAAASRMPLGMRRAYGDLSNRVLDSSTVYRQMRASIAEMGSALIDFSRPPEGPAEERLHAFAAAIRPWTADELELRRIGGESDGAYAMAAGTTATGAISVGVGHDVSWDAAIATQGIEVWMFDPTVPAPPAEVSGGRFLQIGIGDPATAHPALAGCDLRPLDALVETAGMRDRHDLLLKLDVEGAEWEALRDADLTAFEQVLVEMHDLQRLADPAAADAILAAITRVSRTHRPVHVHANNERPFHRFGRIWFPEVVETSFVRLDLLPDARPADALQTSLDRPSNPAYPDYDLSGILSAST